MDDLVLDILTSYKVELSLVESFISYNETKLKDDHIQSVLKSQQNILHNKIKKYVDLAKK